MEYHKPTAMPEPQPATDREQEYQTQDEFMRVSSWLAKVETEIDRLFEQAVGRKPAKESGHAIDRMTVISAHVGKLKQTVEVPSGITIGVPVEACEPIMMILKRSYVSTGELTAISCFFSAINAVKRGENPYAKEVERLKVRIRQQEHRTRTAWRIHTEARTAAGVKSGEDLCGWIRERLAEIERLKEAIRQVEQPPATGKPIPIYGGDLHLSVKRKRDGLIRLSFDSHSGFHPATWDLQRDEALALVSELRGVLGGPFLAEQPPIQELVANGEAEALTLPATCAELTQRAEKDERLLHYLGDNIAQVAFAHGWTLDKESMTLNPPKGHPSVGWATEWMKIDSSHGAILLPHWFGRVVVEQLSAERTAREAAERERDLLEGAGRSYQKQLLDFAESHAELEDRLAAEREAREAAETKLSEVSEIASLSGLSMAEKLAAMTADKEKLTVSLRELRRSDRIIL